LGSWTKIDFYSPILHKNFLSFTFPGIFWASFLLFIDFPRKKTEIFISEEKKKK